jgi:CRP/FNR family transcriptional regulator, cyclic AMP receptor protein
MISSEEFRQYAYFAGAPHKVLVALANSSTVRKFKAGERIFEEGHPAKHLMIVKSGQVDIIYQLGDNREVVAESAISGDVISWSAVLAPYQLTASAVGSKDGELIEVGGRKILEICEADESLGYQLMTEIAKGLRNRLTGLRVQIAAAR